ncbi:hypothetical protein Taro_037360, partial [Colocasia esculenta]|nr:hypothetical protein [Colocasia esculenta]
QIGSFKVKKRFFLNNGDAEKSLSNVKAGLISYSSKRSLGNEVSVQEDLPQDHFCQKCLDVSSWKHKKVKNAWKKKLEMKLLSVALFPTKFLA